MVRPSEVAILSSHRVVLPFSESWKRVPAEAYVISGIHVETKLYDPAAIEKLDIVGKMLHEKNAPSTRLFKVFRGRRVREVMKIKTSAGILHPEL